ncbi:MAG: YdbL family protein [Magnetococcales bacterium]|nr:YdbL family protein [Magnetococcales bacterium]
MIKKSPINWLFWLFPLFLTACVTVNVYFPAPAMDEAAEQMVREIWDGLETPQESQSLESESTPGPQSHLNATGLITAFLDWTTPSAHAGGADINVSTAAIRQLKDRLRSRASKELRPFFHSGAVGIDKRGDLTVRSESGLSLKDRSRLRRLIKADNQDRESLYREIAQANGHPEWNSDIRDRFARQWREQAHSGWWVQLSDGQWQQK